MANNNPPDKKELREMVQRMEGAAQDADGNPITGDVDHLNERTEKVAEMIEEINARDNAAVPPEDKSDDLVAG